jgi:hypothetical protein
MATPNTLATTDDFLTSLEALAGQADQAGTTQWRAGATWEGDALKELACQVRLLVQAADKHINP